jgi:signal transduction histidine kinase
MWVLEPRRELRLEPREAALLRERLAVVFALSRNYLFFPFAVLSLVATVAHSAVVPRFAAVPFLLLVVAAIAGNRVADAFERAADADAVRWGRRLIALSAANGAIWGLGAIIWFVPNAFGEEAYLVLAMLGMSATEFISRAAYRPAYLAHALTSLSPLALMLAWEGGAYPSLTAMLVLFFAGVLYTYGSKVQDLVEQCLLIRQSDARQISDLSAQKDAAEGRREAAQASDRAKSAFISQISHELRTPLNAILGMAQLLERSDLEKSQRDHVRVLIESGRGLRALLDDVIDLARDETGSPDVPEQGCDAGQAARTIVRLLQPNAWEKRLRLSVNVPPGLPRVAADPRLLRRVLLKLVVNAVKFTERGHIEVALETVGDARERKMVRISVTDTGPGVPPHLLDAIFEPFGKPEPPRDGRRAGAGIGLAVAKHLLEIIGGQIGVESEPGMGAKFWVTVPATTVTPLHERDDQTAVPPPQGLAVLL